MNFLGAAYDASPTWLWQRSVALVRAEKTMFHSLGSPNVRPFRDPSQGASSVCENVQVLDSAVHRSVGDGHARPTAACRAGRHDAGGSACQQGGIVPRDPSTWL